jgi:hypothetical protein
MAAQLTVVLAEEKARLEDMIHSLRTQLSAAERNLEAQVYINV